MTRMSPEIGPNLILFLSPSWLRFRLKIRLFFSEHAVKLDSFQTLIHRETA